MEAVTAPGSDVYPFDPSVCHHGVDVKCSGRIGCRVNAAAAATFNRRAGTLWRDLAYSLREPGSDANQRLHDAEAPSSSPVVGCAPRARESTELAWGRTGSSHPASDLLAGSCASAIAIRSGGKGPLHSGSSIGPRSLPARYVPDGPCALPRQRGALARPRKTPGVEPRRWCVSRIAQSLPCTCRTSSPLAKKVLFDPPSGGSPRCGRAPSSPSGTPPRRRS